MLKTDVIVRNVKNLHDARYCAGMGVEFISMPVSSDIDGALTVEQINEIADWLSGIKIVGFTSAKVLENPEAYKTDAIEISSSQIIDTYISKGITPILSFKISPEELNDSFAKDILEPLKYKVSFFVLECAGKYSNYDESLIQKLKEHYSIYWGFNFDSEDIVSFVESFNPKGIALKGTEEIKTGVNNFDELADLLEALDTDEYA
ncbi:hypothetical protein [Chondrinema litorale]|uniref:hypothetical protein n=1 Tax=Chondrinema litorale TaxID=2994555 RepID=UPI002543B8A7|nr:hypothetical protein [Chondrinema litorale]UZR95920.1 hypothetical protein OQ292_08850 [Chondrinema litorale]